MSFFHTKGGFFKAVRDGDVETVREYLTKDKNWAKKWKKRKTALHACLEHDGNLAKNDSMLEIVRLLIAAGADVNARKRAGEFSNDTDCPLETATELLSDIKLGPVVVRPFKDSFLEETIEILLNNGARHQTDYALRVAVSKNQARTIKALLGAGVDPHSAENCLHDAAGRGNIEIARDLIKAGSKPNAKDRNGDTPLHLAAKQGHTDMIAFLLKSGTPAYMTNSDGKTALDVAKEYGMDAAIALLAPQTTKALEKILPPAEEESDKWLYLSRDRVAHVGTYPDIGRKLTEIFDFAACERRTISENLATGAESAPVTDKFPDLSEDTLRAALDAFTKAGGKANEEKVFRGHLHKKTSGLKAL